MIPILNSKYMRTNFTKPESWFKATSSQYSNTVALEIPESILAYKSQFNNNLKYQKSIRKLIINSKVIKKEKKKTRISDQHMFNQPTELSRLL